MNSDEKKPNAIKTVGLMMIISLIGKMLGLVRNVLKSSAFGVESIESIAFSNASLLAQTFLDIAFASVITGSFIPIFNEIYEREGRREAYKLSNIFITLIVVATSAVVVVAMAGAQPIMNALMHGVTGGADTIQLATRLFQIMLPLVTLSAVAFCLTGILQCMGEFNIPSAMSVASNLIIIVYLLFFREKYGIEGLAWAFLLGWAAQLLMQVPALIKKGFRYRPDIRFRHSGIKKIGRLMLPVMISTWAAPVNIFVGAKFANFSGISVAALDNGYVLYSIITGVFVLSLSNLLFPQLSRLTAADDKESFGESLLASLRTLMFFLLPMTAGLIILSEPLIRTVYERGLFDASATRETTSALIYYSLGMLGYGVHTILSRGFYAMKDGKTPVYTSLLAIAVNAALCFPLAGVMGIGGIALASSISITAAGAFMLVIMYRRNRRILNKAVMEDAVKIVCATILMSVTVYIGARLLSGVLQLAVPVIAGLALYLIMCRALRVQEAQIFFGIVKKFFGRKK